MAVFGLKKIYLNQVANNYENYDQVTVSSYGYYGGGYISSGVFKSDFDRLDYSNETATLLPSTISFGRAHHSIVQKDAEYGYLAGGFGGPTSSRSSNIDKIDLSNEVVSRLPVNYPRVAMYGAYGVYTPQYGYYAGYDDGDGHSSYIDRLNFSDETFSTLPAVLPDSKRLTSGLHSSIYGYWFGGVPSNGTGRINFSDETVGSIPGLPSATARTSALTGDAAIIYSGNGGVCSIDRFTFSGETTATTTALRSSSSADLYVGSSESSEYGYFVGGGGPPVTSTIDRYDFSHDTNVRSNSSLTTVRGRLSGGGGINGGSKITRGKPQFNSIQRDFELYGYFCGGNIPSIPVASASLVERVDFSTDTNTELGSKMSYAQRELDAVYEKNYGYIAGGYDSAPGVMPTTGDTRVDRLDTTSETFSIVGNLPSGARIGKATQTTSYGYWDRGESDSSTLMRFDFSTYSSQNSVDLPLASRRTAGSYENQLYGYYAGYVGGTRVQRLDFITEGTALLPGTVYAPPKASEGSATQNIQFGYVLGAETNLYPTLAFTTFERMEFANETFVEIPSVHSSTGVKQGAATQNASTSWYIDGRDQTKIFKLDFDTETSVAAINTIRGRASNPGGITGRSTLTQTIQNTLKESPKYAYYAAGDGAASSVERLDNATETISAPPVKRVRSTYAMAAAENSQYGYFFGGFDGANRTTIQRLDFSSDIFSVSNSNISIQNNRITSAYTDDYAYVFGSYQKSPSPTPYKSKTSIDRFEYDNETLKVFGGMSSEAREGMFGTQSAYFGYVTGGSMNPPTLGVSRVDKLDFTTEISSVLTEGLSHNRRLGAAVQNQNFGYFAGGQTTPGTGNRTNVDRVDFSTETITHPGNYDLTQARQGLSGSESSDYGYFIGGFAPGATVCTFERLEFETETLSLPGGSANSIMYSNADGLNGGSSLRQVGKNNRNDSRAGLDNQGRQIKDPTYGYFIEGYDGPFASFVDRIDFSNETYSDTGSRGVNVASSKGINSGGYMYSVLGSGPSPGTNSRRLDYLNETMSSLSSNLSATNASYNPVGNIQSVSRAKAYFGGGYISSSNSTSQVGRADLTNETASLLGTNTIHEVGDGSAVCNGNYGYWGGGYARGVNFVVSTIQRIEFDTEVIVDTGQTLREERGGTQAIQNRTANYGYFAGGNNPGGPPSDFSCHIDRLDLTTESSSQYGNPMPTKKFRQNTVSGSEYGYYIGGVTTGPVDDTSDVYRMEFSTETLETRSPFIRQNSNSAATANQTF
jgi:hypothetical protein